MWGMVILEEQLKHTSVRGFEILKNKREDSVVEFFFSVMLHERVE